ncbi:MAG: hypothetical protein WCK26_03155 [Candidatus Saccharibacteria bacterium]
MEKEATLNANSSLLNNRKDLFFAAADGISDVIKLQGFEPVLMIEDENCTAIIDHSENVSYNPYRQQIELQHYLSSLVDFAPNITNNRPDYILTDQDIYPEGMNMAYALGCTPDNAHLSIQSIARIVRATENPLLQYDAVRHIARHEFGHIIGMNSESDYFNPDKRPGLYEGHCANDCTMHQVMSPEEAIEAAEYLKDYNMAGFCIGCVIKIRAKSIKEHFINTW